MKKLVAAIAAIALFGTPAFAQAPPPAPAPVYNWTGWYVGGNVGASFGTFKTDFNAVPGTLTILSGGGSATSTIPGFAGRDEVYPAGFIGGGQIGYNWQYSPLIVLGVEADFQGANERDGASFSNNVSFIAQAQQIGGGTAPVPFSATAVTNYATKIEWFGTVRGRIGYVWGNGDVMSYLTGGAGLRQGRY
jgi:outer membrane immunogenic protein